MRRCEKKEQCREQQQHGRGEHARHKIFSENDKLQDIIRNFGSSRHQCTIRTALTALAITALILENNYTTATMAAMPMMESKPSGGIRKCFSWPSNGKRRVE